MSGSVNIPTLMSSVISDIPTDIKSSVKMLEL